MPGDPRPHDHDNSIKNNHNNRGALVTLFEVNPDPKPIDVLLRNPAKPGSASHHNPPATRLLCGRLATSDKFLLITHPKKVARRKVSFRLHLYHLDRSPSITGARSVTASPDHRLSDNYRVLFCISDPHVRRAESKLLPLGEPLLRNSS